MGKVKNVFYYNRRMLKKKKTGRLGKVTILLVHLNKGKVTGPYIV